MCICVYRNEVSNRKSPIHHVCNMVVIVCDMIEQLMAAGGSPLVCMVMEAYTYV